MPVNRCKGFTLTELAVATVIIALLLASAFFPFATQMDLRSISDTLRTMSDIKEATIGFAQANGRLPCPANGAIAAGSANAGVEQLTGNSCTSSVGVVPWATLGVNEVDAWGRRFTYRVSPAFADYNASGTWGTQTSTTPASPANQVPACNPTPTPAAPASFALCTLGDIAVFSPTESTRTSTPTDAISTGVPAIIISHGKNGYGAYQSSGVRMPMPSGTHELANANGTDTANPSGSHTSWTYYSRPPTSATTGACSDTATGASPFCEFDDIVAWISPSTLVARMVSAGRLP